MRIYLPMAAIKTEHSGAKNGGGFWGTRSMAKKLSKRLRRIAARKQVDRSRFEYHKVFGDER
tara:strand:+ start:84 stop:269 length:186 start_codon:yes stop_codon:yes gene_type:complete